MQLDLDGVFKKQSECESINKRYPLLSDGENLLIVTAEVIKKEKKVREELSEEHKSLSESIKSDSSKRKKEEEARKEKMKSWKGKCN